MYQYCITSFEAFACSAGSFRMDRSVVLLAMVESSQAAIEIAMLDIVTPVG